MKKLVEVVEGEGLEALLGEKIFVFTPDYFYYGKLIGVNTNDILLEDAELVYDTGDWKNAPKWTLSAKLPMKNLYIRTSAIEAYGVLPS